MSAPTRLAVYGTLCPGRVNHHEVSGIPGEWSTGTVKGRLYPEGWGAALGYPGLVLDPDGAEIEVHILASSELPLHWPRLDDFEGEGYRRVAASVRTSEGEVDAFLYVLAADPGA